MSRSWNRKVRLSVMSLAALLALATAALFGLQPDPALASAPTITGAPTITSSPASGTTYAAKENITLTMTFSENVTVTKKPAVLVKIGNNKKRARYTGGSGTTTLTFSYLVKPDDIDTDGISIGKSQVELMGGTIKDAANDAANLSHAKLAAQTGHKVNGGAGPKISSGPTVTSSPASGDTYAAKEKITLTVTFSEAVTVTGTSRLPIRIGSKLRYAFYESGSDSTTLTFSYQVIRQDADANGISTQMPIGLGKNGSIKDSDGNAAILKHGGLSHQTGHKVNGTLGPRISSGPTVTSSPASGDTYAAKEKITLTVTFSEAVTVTGKPRLPIWIGSKLRNARYESGSGTTTLTFSWQVIGKDSDADGISSTKPIGLGNNSAIKDSDGNAAKLKHGGLAAQSGHKVNGGK